MASEDTISRALSQGHCPVFKVPMMQRPAAPDNDMKAATVTENTGGAAAAKRGSVTVSKVPLHEALKVEAGNHIRGAGVAGLAWHYLKLLWITVF
ncbi:hypothetical protein FRC00_006652, partial [Tulasnella sp. 408]